MLLVGRARDRQVAPRAAPCASGSRRSRTRGCSLPVLALPSEQPAPPGDRAAGARGRLRARRRAGGSWTSWRRCSRRRSTTSREAVPLLAALLGDPDRRPLPARSTLTPQRQKERTLQALLDQLEGLAAPAAGAGALRGRALDRPDDAGAARPRDRAHRAPAGARCGHLPARVRAALDRPGLRHLAHAQPAQPRAMPRLWSSS